MRGKNRDDGGNHLGYWGFSVALALCCLIVGVLAFSQGRETERRNQYPANYTQSAKESAVRSCTGAEPSAVFECVYEKVESSADAARAELDLDAQQGMKFWAALMFWTACATVAVTSIGIWFVKGTLDATLVAVAETGKATDAMLEANNIAREQLAAEFKPTIDIQVVGFSVSEMPNGGPPQDNPMRNFADGETERGIIIRGGILLIARSKPFTVLGYRWTMIGINHDTVFDVTTFHPMIDGDTAFLNSWSLDTGMEAIGSLATDVVTPENRHGKIHNWPIIVGYVDYLDALGNERRHGFGFRPPAFHHTDPLPRWGDREHNYDNIIGYHRAPPVIGAEG